MDMDWVKSKIGAFMHSVNYLSLDEYFKIYWLDLTAIKWMYGAFIY
jgi:hypothetical protein